MPMSGMEKERLQAKLEEVGALGKCSRCGNREVRILDAFVAGFFSEAPTGPPTPSPSAIMHFAMVTCTRCAATTLHSMRHLGLV